MGPGFEPLSAHPITTRSFDLVVCFLHQHQFQVRHEKSVFFKKVLHSFSDGGILLSVVDRHKENYMGR